MKPPADSTRQNATTRRDAQLRRSEVVRSGLLKLLAVKDSDVRQLILEQCRDAVDKSLHAGGALSATIPLVALYYGGFLRLDVRDPTRRGQDMFVLSKGHAVAALAAIYAELGYFDRAHLANSRSYRSILNGHPGPILPGVAVATGPMGQGLGVAQGFAIAGRTSPRYDVYTLTGDGDTSGVNDGVDEGSDSNRGVVIAGQAQVSSTGVDNTTPGSTAAAIVITGNGAAGEFDNRGILVVNAGTLVTSVDGDITMTGNGGGSVDGEWNNGVAIVNGAAVSS